MPRKRWPETPQRTRAPKPRPRVVVTDGENVGALAAVRGLECAGYEPWVVSPHAYAPAFRSRAAAGTALVPNPSRSSEEFVAKLADISGAIEPAAILPGGETGMFALARYADRLPSGVEVAVCDVDTVARATDKAALTELAESAGLHVPPTFETTADEVLRDVPVELPVVIKPQRSQVADGDGFRAFDVVKADTREEVATALRALPEQCGLLQHYFTGELSGVGGVFWDGRLVTTVHQRAVRTWPAGCGEMSFAVATPRDRALEQGISRMLADLGWAGLFQLQFLDTDDDRLLIDLNPRVYGSLALALGAGPNLAAVWADLVTGHEVPQDDAYEPGVCFRNEVLDGRALFAAYTSSPYGRAPRNDRNGFGRQRTINAYFEPSDPKPLLAVPPMFAARYRARAARNR